MSKEDIRAFAECGDTVEIKDYVDVQYLRTVRIVRDEPNHRWVIDGIDQSGARVYLYDPPAVRSLLSTGLVADTAHYEKALDEAVELVKDITIDGDQLKAEMERVSLSRLWPYVGAGYRTYVTKRLVNGGTEPFVPNTTTLPASDWPSTRDVKRQTGSLVCPHNWPFQSGEWMEGDTQGNRTYHLNSVERAAEFFCNHDRFGRYFVNGVEAEITFLDVGKAMPDPGEAIIDIGGLTEGKNDRPYTMCIVCKAKPSVRPGLPHCAICSDLIRKENAGDKAASEMLKAYSKTQTTLVETVEQAEELGRRQADGEILITDVQFAGSIPAEYPTATITIVPSNDPEPDHEVLLPKELR